MFAYVETRTKASIVTRIGASGTVRASHSSQGTSARAAASYEPRRAKSFAPCVFELHPSSPVVRSVAGVAGSAWTRPSRTASPELGGGRPFQRTPSLPSTLAAAPRR